MSLNNSIQRVLKAVIKQREEAEKNKTSPSSAFDNELFSLLYSRDEKGCLDISLGYVLGGNAPVELQQYVSKNLLQSSRCPRSDCHDVDVALENIVPFDMQFGRERDFVTKSVLDRFNTLVGKKSD